MASNTPARQRRSVPRPISYKEFAETRHKQSIPDGSDMDQQALMSENNLEENSDSSTGETNYADTSNEIQGYDGLEVETNASGVTQSSVDEEVHIKRNTGSNSSRNARQHADHEHEHEHEQDTQPVHDPGNSPALKSQVKHDKHNIRHHAPLPTNTPENTKNNKRPRHRSI